MRLTGDVQAVVMAGGKVESGLSSPFFCWANLEKKECDIC